MTTHEGHPKDDPRSVEELISVVLSEHDEDLAWDAVTALHWRGTGDVFEAALRLCRSECAVERKVGADVLGQLGVPDRTYPGETSNVVLDMLKTEQDAMTASYWTELSVLAALVSSLAFQSQGDEYIKYNLADVRQAFQPH